MATVNPFDILGDDDNDDPSQLIAAQEKKIVPKKAAPAQAAAPAPAKFPSKPAPPAQTVRESRSNNAPSRGGFGRGGAGRGGGRAGRVSGPMMNTNGFPAGGGETLDRERAPRQQQFRGEESSDRVRAPRQQFHGPHRGLGEESDRPPRRTYERQSGTGRGYELKREGSGRGNWGTVTDESVTQESEQTAKAEEKVPLTDKPGETEGAPPAEEAKENKEGTGNETEEKEPEDKEMTLEEYEKIREEKRKALLGMNKAEERKVEIDKDLQSMQQLSTKKGTDEVFIKLGSDKDALKKKENAERDERAKKALNINEFLKPAEGERYYGGRGRGGGRGGRGSGDRGQFRAGYGPRAPPAPAIEDQSQFPTLGGK